MLKSARWLELLAYLLVHRAPVKRREIFVAVKGYGDPGDDETAFESARRKFERDKDELRALGINIETIALPHAAHDEPQHGYRLAAGDFYLPYVEITAHPVADRPYPGIASIQLA
jgi:proteasome accessory factor B